MVLSFHASNSTNPTSNLITKMAEQPAIPPRDADFDTWLLNFSTLLTAAPATYGLVAGDATAVAGKYTTWHAAYLLATNPATRTSPNVAAKDNARADAEQTVRSYYRRIQTNDNVTDANKVAIGVKVLPTTNTPIVVPDSFPQLSLRSSTPGRSIITYQDSVLTSGKAKAPGAVGIEVVASVGTAIAVDPDSAPPKTIVTKSPFALRWDAGQSTKVATVWGRYLTRSGVGGEVQKGPWCPALSFTII